MTERVGVAWTAHLRRALIFAVGLLVAAAVEVSSGVATYEPLIAVEASDNRPLVYDASTAAIHRDFGPASGERYRGADLEAYLTAAEVWLEEGRFEHGYAAFWTPGAALLSATVIGLSGPEAYPRRMAWASVALWTIALTALLGAVAPRRRRDEAAAIALLLSLWLWPGIRGFTFGFGAVMSEAAAHAVLVIGWAALIRLVDEGRLRFGVAGGVALGVAILFRVFFEYLTFGLFIALPLVGLVVILARRRPRTLDEARRSRGLRIVAGLLLALLASQAALLPWRLYKKAHFGRTRLVEVDDKYAFKWAFVEDDAVPWYHRTGNTACHVDRARCAEIRARWEDLDGREVRGLVRGAFLAHPFAWIAHKARHANWIWLGRSWPDVAARPILWIEGLAHALLGVAGLALLVGRIRRREAAAWWKLGLLGAVVGVYGALFVTLQFEWRYSMGLRILLYYAPILALSGRVSAGAREAGDRRAAPPAGRSVGATEGVGGGAQ